MPFPEQTVSSPNVTADRVHERLGVCFHHSVMSYEATIDYMLKPASQVSYHGLVARDGRRCTLAEDTKIAWHAGVSTFRGRSRCNDFLLGFSFEGDTYADPLTEAQIASALEWLEQRWKIFGWSSLGMTDHRQISPGRKDDLNPTEWERWLRCIEERFGQ